MLRDVGTKFETELFDDQTVAVHEVIAHKDGQEVVKMVGFKCYKYPHFMSTGVS